MRLVAIFALVWCLAAPAEAYAWGAPPDWRYDDIMHVRDIDFAARGIEPEMVLDVLGAPAGEPWALGYRYQRRGMFRLDLDLWRSHGHFVIYSGRAYYPLSDEQASLLGADGAPLAYHLPPLLVILIVIGEFLLIAALAWRGVTFAVRTVLIVAGVHAAIAIGFLFSPHMEIQTAAIGWLAVFLGIAALRALRAAIHEDEADASDEEDDAEPARTRARPRKVPRALEPPPRLNDDPFRSAPQPPPITTVPPPRPITATPIVPDEDAEPPTTLR